MRAPRPLLVPLLAAAALLAPSAAGAAVHVEAVDTSDFPAIGVTVLTDAPSQAAPKLTENGAPVGGAEATNLGRGKNVVLAIDRSRSMAGRSLRRAAAAADAFVLAKPNGDSIRVVAFGRQALSLTGFSTSTIDADGALRSVAVDRRAGTALYDAVVLASQQLRARPFGARVLILLTDGRDVSSVSSLDEAVAAAVSAHVAVYAIAISGPEFTPAPLRRLASATGGSFFRAADASTLDAVYSTIASQLARTWRIRYLTAARPGERVTLRATVPGQGAAARDVQVPAGPGGAPGPSRLIPPSMYGGALGTVAVALAAGFCVLLALLAVLAARRSVWVRDRLVPHLAPTRANRSRAKGERFRLVATVIRATERMLGDVRQFRALARLLERADLPLKAAELAYMMAGAGLVLGVIVAVASSSVLGLLAGFVAGAALPVGFVAFKARRRLKRFDDQLPDLLVTVAASLKAGHSFRQSIQSVVDEGQEPASEEFRRVLTDTQLGRPMEDSLTQMADRVGSKNFRFVITAVTIQRQVGGSLASLFDMVADTVRQRQQFARRIRSLTAMGRMSAYVLVGLPFGLSGLLTVMNPKFMSPLWQTHTGHLLVALGLTMMLVGSAILKKIVSFRG
jgi:tight adherence protein B